MDEIKLLDFKIMALERNLLKILRGVNNRLNKLEDKENESNNTHK